MVSFTVSVNEFDRDASGHPDVLIFNQGGVVTALIGGRKTTDAGGAFNALGVDSVSILSGAVGAGNNAAGARAIAIGHDVMAAAADSIAMGDSANAAGANSISLGKDSNAATNCTAVGAQCQATTSPGACAFGIAATASATGAIAMGATNSATRN